MEMTTRENTQIIYQLVFYLLDEHNHLLNIETTIYASIIHSSLKHLLILLSILVLIDHISLLIIYQYGSMDIFLLRKRLIILDHGYFQFNFHFCPSID